MKRRDKRYRGRIGPAGIAVLWLLTVSVSAADAQPLTAASNFSLIQLLGGIALAMLLILVCLLMVNRHEKEHSAKLNAALEAAERANRENSEKVKILNAAGYGLWKFTFDDSGNINGLIGNEKWHEIFGVPKVSFTPAERLAYYNDRLTEQSREEIKDDYAVMRTGIVMKRVFQWQHPEKGPIFLQAGGTVYEEQSGALAVSGFITDVTESVQELAKLNERLALAAKQAQAANRAKTTFLFNMSHDIRTPMNAIIGYSHLMRQHWGDKEKTTDYLDKLETSGQVLLSLIDHVLEMARIESGAVELKETVINVHQFFDETMSVIGNSLQEKNLDFTSDICVTHPEVYGDRTKLRQIFMNIISNAIKYTPVGGSIHVKLTELPCDVEGQTLFRIVVSDTGIGMSPEFLPHIFDEFARAENTTHSGIPGTGLGMPIVKSLVEQMGGTITVESEPGKGSTFTFELPHRIVEPTEETPEPKQNTEMQAEVRDYTGNRILLAEDNALNAEIATAILESYGFTVTCAEDGQDCVDRLLQAAPGTYQLILMDVQMPKKSGYEATAEIRGLSDPALRDIPIVAMTANAFAEDVREALQHGMNAHVAKPIDVQNLIRTIAGLLGEP